MKYIDCIAKEYITKDSKSRISPDALKNSKNLIIEGVRIPSLLIDVPTNIETIDIHVEVGSLFLTIPHKKIDISFHKRVSSVTIQPTQDDLSLNILSNNIDTLLILDDIYSLNITNNGKYIGKIITFDIENYLSIGESMRGGKYINRQSIINLICIQNKAHSCRVWLRSDILVDRLLYKKYPLRLHNNYIRRNIQSYTYMIEVSALSHNYIHNGNYCNIRYNSTNELSKPTLEYIFPLLL